MLQKGKKGWICLDIDGTITADILTIPQDVLLYLEKLYNENWHLVFVTGRTFSLACKPLVPLQASYYLIAQNGASSFEMPQKNMLFKKYLPIEVFYNLEKLIKKEGHDFILFTGYDQGEEVFYRPKYLGSEVLNYVETSLKGLSGTWKAIDSFHDLQVTTVPYGKIYGQRESLQKIAPILNKVPSVKVHLVQDSVNPNFSILQVMRKDVDKGKAVLEILGKTTLPSPIISAGNDNNDETLLQIADIKIAMSGSPSVLLDQATIIAPSVEKMGIIAALELAIKQIEGNHA